MVTHAIKARAVLNNPGLTLRPGLFAKARVIFERIHNALRIPEQAILSMNNKTYVYVIKDNTAKLTHCTYLRALAPTMRHTTHNQG